MNQQQQFEVVVPDNTIAYVVFEATYQMRETNIAFISNSTLIEISNAVDDLPAAEVENILKEKIQEHIFKEEFIASSPQLESMRQNAPKIFAMSLQEIISDHAFGVRVTKLCIDRAGSFLRLQEKTE